VNQPMKTSDKWILQYAFALKGNFAGGVVPETKAFDGIEVAPFKYASAAAVSLSADFELDWARRSRPSGERDAFGETERENVPYILGLLDDLSIPITWATVGHLFLSDCKKNGSNAHPEMPRPPVNRMWSGDWYIHDPCTNHVRDPLWYAPDLIEKILGAKTRHEIGSHSFSHIDFSTETSSRELVKSELEECRHAMQPFGLRQKSLVFPFNKMGYPYLDLLYDEGIIAVRHRDKKTRLSYPERTKQGVYKIYESMSLRAPTKYDLVDKARVFLDRAIKQRASYHFWFHPSDPHPLFENQFTRLLELIQSERESGKLWVTTMQELASYCEARASLNLRVKERSASSITLLVESSLKTEKYDLPEVTLTLPRTSLPARILLESSGTVRELKPAKDFAIRNGKLTFSLPATGQTVRLVF
jgi:peptidoglycan/xylan/chitin deacetylase (PgdA/CDA1 family)